MNLNEINFTFDGLHCMRDFGLMYVEEIGHPITAATWRNEYEIAGFSGSLLMPGETKQTKAFAGKLYFVDSPASQAEAQENLRRIGAWLTKGRAKLIFDYEPTRYYLAQVDESTDWGFGEWVDGGLAIMFKAQPFAYNASESLAQVETTTTSLDLPLVIDSGQQAPLCIELTNTGTAPITAFGAALNGRSVAFAGMSIAKDGQLQISLEPPVSAVYGTGESALDKATVFSQLLATPGPNTVDMTIGYGVGTKGASIKLSARGRY